MMFVLCCVLALAAAHDPDGQFGAPHNTGDDLSFKVGGYHGHVAAVAAPALGHPAWYGHGAYHGAAYGHGYGAVGTVDHLSAPHGHDDNLDDTDGDHADDHKAYYPHGYAAHGVYGYGYVKHAPILSCIQRWEDADKNVVNSISVNIKNREGYGYGYGYDGYAAGHAAGLEGQINVFSTTGGPVTIALTENAAAECASDKYGNFLGASFPMHGGAYGFGYGHHKPVGVLAKTTVSENMLASFHIDHLAGFSTLPELAGRGVIVCNTENVVYGLNGHTYCKEDGISCCALHYSHQANHLGAAGGDDDHSDE